ncbi:MAG: phosphate:Na+ symporter [Planctomycetota bacterium]|jgi:phosphate:Na+ symporter
MTELFTVLGGLGVFLFGLRIMSGGLQKLAGARLRSVLAGLTRNRFTGVFSGFLITCAVQSSSATTVLVVSFANAGLLSLTQTLGLVMGANIGTTVTAWIVALLGFKLKIAAFALPIIGLGFPMSLLKSPRTKHMSEVMIGFGLLFLGLSFLKDAVPDFKSNPAAFEFVKTLTGYGFGSTILFVVLGTVLTVLVQSSSASTAITLTMVAKGWIDLDLAAAMILGENIGTTITAQLASIGANRDARRVATFHTLFNVIGVAWMLIVMPFVLELIRIIISGNAETNMLVATAQVALFHTLFNVTNTAVLIGFVGKLEALVLRLVPVKDAERESTHLEFLESGLLGTPELAGVEVRRGVEQMVQVCRDAFTNVTEVITNPNTRLGNLVEDIWREEEKTDAMELEIIEFCSQWARSGTSERVGRDVARFLEMANDIERIGDHCTNLVLLAQRRFDKGYSFDAGAQSELASMATHVGQFLDMTIAGLRSPELIDMSSAKMIEQKINRQRDESRQSEAKRVEQAGYELRRGLLYLDMMTNMEKIGDYCWNVIKMMQKSHEDA